MNFLFFGWLYGAPVLAGIIAWFSKFWPVRWIMGANAIVPLVGYAAPLWTARYFNSIGCDGNVIKGIECPEWTIIGRIAVWHDSLSFLSVFYVLFIFPFVVFFLAGIISALTPARWWR